MSLSKFTKECRIGMKWRIKEDFLKESLTKLENKIYTLIDSDDFKASSIPGVEYSLCLELDDANSNVVDIFLFLDVDIMAKIIADFTISVKSASFKLKFVDKVYENCYRWGDEFFTRDKVFTPMSKFFVDGIMEIELKGTLKHEGGIKRKTTEPLSLGKRLWERDDKDVTIAVEERRIKVHKWVICDNSPVFKAELESGLKESVENKIIVTDFCFDTVEIAMKYLYEHDIKDLINEENASEMLHFSDKYNIEALHDLIQALLIEMLCETNVCRLANMSMTSNANDLRECCICFLMKFVGQSALIEDFEKLDAEITNEIGRRCFLSTSVSE